MSIGPVRLLVCALLLSACGDALPDLPKDSGPADTGPQTDAIVVAPDTGARDDVGIADTTADSSTVDTIVADASVDASSSDSTYDTLSPDSTYDTLSPDSTYDTLSPDSTYDTLSPDSTHDTLSPDSTYDTLSPDTTYDTGPTAYYVSALTGNDSYPGTQSQPFKTITHAASVVSAGRTIYVAPGTYDTANGEAFPIAIPADVTLEGDVASKGAGNVETLISGGGVVAIDNIYTAALEFSEGTIVRGFLFDAASTLRHFNIYCRDVSAEISSNTFRTGYGGVRLLGSGTTRIADNVFDNTSYGVYAISLSGAPVIEDNEILTGPSLPIDLSGGTPTVRRNHIVGRGSVGIQVQNGGATIENNIFSRPGGYTYGCVRVNNDSARIRGNTCEIGAHMGIRITGGGTPDLGTTADPGNNVFLGLSGLAIAHENGNTINAVGNRYYATPPICGEDITTSDGGVVIWGPGPSDRCPYGYDIFVDSIGGLDTNQGTSTSPYKTITHAMSQAQAGQKVRVLPGLYDSANGETFPLVIPQGVVVDGDIATRGLGAPYTTISGQGVVPGDTTSSAAVILSEGAAIRGFHLLSATAVRNYNIYSNGVSSGIASNTLETAYGGIRLRGAGAPHISNNVLDSASYGIYAVGISGAPLIERNSFLTDPNLPIDLSGGAAEIRYNNIVGSGQVGVQVSSGDHLFEHNTIAHASGYTYGCFRLNGGAPKLRRNTCDVGAQAGIRITGSGQPDLGTVDDPGGNTFAGASGLALSHENSNAIMAIGNTWYSNPPVCGQDIVITAAGVVTWGAGPSERCP